VYDFTINKSTTIGSLISNINGSDLGKAGVSAYLDNSGKLSFSNPDDNKALGFQEIRDASQPEDDIKILELLGFNDSSGVDTTTVVSNLSYTHLSSSGVDAKVKFNGVDASYSSNTFTISGITFTAKKLQTTDLDVTVGTNVDTVYNSIKAFVDKYNDTISAINSKLSEQKNRDFPPLTDDQRKTMSEDDIKNWEEKAKKGTLENDTILDGSLYSLRNAWSNPISSIPSSDLKQLAQIGITTGTFTDQGKLIIDENKLRQAISENPDQVSAMFTTDDGIASSESGDGLAVRIYNQTDSIMKQIKDKAGSDTSGIGDYTLGKSLQDLNKRIDDFNTRMQAVEDHYYTQFDAMEKFISQMNQQSTWLTQQLGGASGS
jgi:flagellar hook-associated protein 2